MLRGKTRGEVKAEGKLGYIAGGRSEGPPAIGKTQPKTRLCRNKQLELFNKYLDDTAYDHLRDWWDGLKDETPVRKRKPFLRLPLPKLLASRVSARLAGSEVFPEISIEDDPESEYYFKLIQRTSLVQAAMVSAAKSLTINGSVFVRFFIVGQKFMVEHYNSNYCYPEFDAAGELAAVRVQYVFTDNSDIDAYGKPKRKWFRAEFGSMVDVLFDNPEYDPDSEPLFQVMQQVEHGLGFVQGEWFKTGNLPNTDDGPSIMEDMIPFLDAMNYSLSLSQESTDYNTAPQLGIKGMDEDEIDTLIRSNAKAWAMGREGQASFIESNLGGVETSINLRDKNRQVIQDVTRVILLDPEKIAGSAQSGKAMEILHGPMVELINELRPQFGLHLKSIIMKMAIANLFALRMSGVAPVMVPAGWVPVTPDFMLEWPPVFPLTTADLQQEVSLVSSAVSGNLISRRTGVKRLAKYFGIEDIEAELNEIVNQPQLSSPFGMF